MIMAEHPSQCPCTIIVPAAPSGAVARQLSIQQLENKLILTQNILQQNDVSEETRILRISIAQHCHQQKNPHFE